MSLRTYETVLKAIADPNPNPQDSGRGGTVRLPDHRGHRPGPIYDLEAPFPSSRRRTDQGPPGQEVDPLLPRRKRWKPLRRHTAPEYPGLAER